MEYFLVIVFGAIFGSFASFLSYRLAHDQSLFVANSSCPNCKHKLGFFDLFPIFSWLLLKGRCRYCKVDISSRYPCIEISTVALFLFFYINFGFDFDNLFLAVTFFLLFIAIITDLEHYIIPESIQVLLIISASSYGFFNNYTFNQIVLYPVFAALFGFILKYGFILFRKKDGLGFADITLFYVVTIFIGFENFLVFLSIAGMLGVIFGVVWTRVTKSEMFPFAPALIVSFTICLLIMKNYSPTNILNLLIASSS